MIEADDGPRKSARVSKLTATKAMATKDKNTILNNKIIKETPSLEEETKIQPDDYSLQTHANTEEASVAPGVFPHFAFHYCFK